MKLYIHKRDTRTIVEFGIYHSRYKFYITRSHLYSELTGYAIANSNFEADVMVTYSNRSPVDRRVWFLESAFLKQTILLRFNQIPRP